MIKKNIDKNKIRLKIKSYDHRLIDTSTRQIMDTAVRNGADTIGPIPLPTETRKYTVNKSTFVHKNSRDQYEMRIHKRVIDIVNPSQKIIESLSNLNLPSGVDIEIRLTN